MTYEQFFNLVAKMREAQTRYDKHPYAALLAEKRHMEKTIDNEIARVKAILHERQNSKLWNDNNRKPYMR
jgi:hypothetical protein